MNETSSIRLYSASPRRAELLERMGIRYTSFPVKSDESVTGLSTSEGAVITIAERKLNAGIMSRKSHISYWGLAADTLVLGPEGFMGKPDSADEAAGMLRMLSGKTHRVITGFSVYSPGSNQGSMIQSSAHSTLVEFRDLSNKDISNYVESGEWKGVAGGYRIQQKGAFLINRIDGLWSTVVGLPLSPLYGILTAMSYPFG